jgi:hypothetical protein
LFLASGFVTTGLKWIDSNQALGLELNYGVFLSFFWLSVTAGPYQKGLEVRVRVSSSHSGSQ